MIARENGLEPGDEGYPAGANQFTAGTRTEHPEDVRRRISVGKIVSKLEAIIDAENADTSHILAASKILLDKSLSSLSSMDTTLLDKRDTIEQDQVEAKLRMLINKAEPALLSRILGERARTLQERPEIASDEDQNVA
jgi:hypothetical protein